MMNKLSAEQIDKELMDRDERKPIRKLVDDHIAPVVAAGAGAAAATVGALANLKPNPRLKEVG